MISKSLSFILFLSLTASVAAQKATYNMPKSINLDGVRVTFQKVSSSSSSYFVNYKAENTGSGFLVIDRKLTALTQNDGEIFPTSDKYVLKSGDNKTVYNQFRVKAPVQANADYLTLKLNGFSYAELGAPIQAEKLVLGEGATQTIDQFGIKVMEYNVYDDRVYVQLKCTFNGDINSLGNINLNKLVVNGGKAEVVKKGDVVFSGKSYSFSINITPNGEELSVNFNNVLSISPLNKVHFDDIAVTTTTYIEALAAAEAAETTEEKPETTEETATPPATAELSFSDFMALKKDIELEMNNGGKPVEMAHEFLLEKQVISTAQVIDILSVFNLDGSRLKFAKMAYPFTSDKNKYHMVVGKLEYTKNKQALEEFLEHQ